MPIKPFIFETETFDSEDNILADSDISSELIVLFSVSLYILGIIFEKINIKAIIGRIYFNIVIGIDRKLTET